MKIKQALASLLACALLFSSTVFATETGDAIPTTLPDISAEQQSVGRIEVGQTPQEIAIFEANDIANLYAAYSNAQSQYVSAINKVESGKQAIADAINTHAKDTGNSRFTAVKTESFSSLSAKVKNIGNAATVDNGNQVIQGKVAYGKNRQYVAGTLKPLTVGDITVGNGENSGSQSY